MSWACMECSSGKCMKGCRLADSSNKASRSPDLFLLSDTPWSHFESYSWWSSRSYGASLNLLPCVAGRRPSPAVHSVVTPAHWWADSPKPSCTTSSIQLPHQSAGRLHLHQNRSHRPCGANEVPNASLEMMNQTYYNIILLVLETQLF